MSLARRWMAVKIVESTSRMIGLLSLVRRSTVRLSSPASSSLSTWIWNSSVASSSTRCELSLFFSMPSIAERRADHHAHRRAEHHRQLVDHRQVGRIRDDDDERLAVAAVRHEAVAQHQVRGNRSEQLLIDPELVHVEEVEPIALGQPARRRLFGAALFGRDLARPAPRSAPRGRARRLGCHVHYRFPITDVSWNSGRYSASTMPAITMPMMTSMRRLDHGDEAADLGLDFLVVEIGEAVEHLRSARRWTRPLRSS